MDSFPEKQRKKCLFDFYPVWTCLSSVHFAQVEIFMINPLNVHISEVSKQTKKSTIALMMQKEQCITEAAWIGKVILHSAANNV